MVNIKFIDKNNTYEFALYPDHVTVNRIHAIDGFREFALISYVKIMNEKHCALSRKAQDYIRKICKNRAFV